MISKIVPNLAKFALKDTDLSDSYENYSHQKMYITKAFWLQFQFRASMHELQK